MGTLKCELKPALLALLCACAMLIPSAAGAQTELGSEDDLTVLGISAAAADPDVEIKGFTVFGATQAAYTGALVGPGNVVVNGVLAVSTGAYFVGNSTFASAGKIFINDGTAGQLLAKKADGALQWTSASAMGDNLGDHTATAQLKMGAYAIWSSSDITAARYQINGSTVLAVLPGGSLGVGIEAGVLNSGSSNSFVGYRSGYSNTSGNANSFMGDQAGFTNSEGSGNSFVGFYAGNENTTGSYNSFMGRQAGKRNSTGGYNAFLGNEAGANSYTGSYNSFVGYYAGANNWGGTNNSFLGAYSGSNSNNGKYNSFVGAYAGYFGGGEYNAFIGSYAGYNSWGTQNSVLGYQAAYGNYGSFSSATIMGAGAGYSLTTGSDNTLYGWQAGYNLTSGARNIIIGYDQRAPEATTSNFLNIGGLLYGDLSAKTVGISTRAPQAALDIVSTGTLVNQYAQIWRASDGTVVASMTATGKLYTAVPPSGDNLGNHMATQDLDLNGFLLAGVSTVNMLDGSMAIVPPGTITDNSGYGISIGSGSFSNYNSGVGIGRRAYSNYGAGVGVGGYAYENYNNGVGVGYVAYKNYDYGTGVGYNAAENYNHGVGVGAEAYYNYDYAVGVGYNARNNMNAGVGIGSWAMGNIDYGVGVGYNAGYNDTYAVGVGAHSRKNMPYGSALGAYSYAASSAVALGSMAKANAENSVAIGSGTVNNSTGTASFGMLAVYTSSSVTAAKFYGDGSGLTGVSGSDNLGNHIATQQLEMGNYAINSSSYISAAFYQINGSTMLALNGDNVYLGPNAGKLDTGYGNFFAGDYAGGSNVGGDMNTFVGASAGSSNTGGNRNSFVGNWSGINNSTGEDNTVVGAYGARQNQTGSYNAVLGSQAGYGGGSYSNGTLLGYSAGGGLNGGDGNTFVGWQAGLAATTGDRNIVIGYDQNTSSPAASNQLNIGGVLFGKLDEKTIGISTRAPQAALDIVSTGTAHTEMAQVWRDSSGIIVASMSATGVIKAAKFIGDGSALTGISGGASGPSIDVSTINATSSTPYGGVNITTNVYVQGKLGINTINPQYALEVSSSAGFAGTMLAVSTGTSVMVEVKGTGEVISKKVTVNGGPSKISNTVGDISIEPAGSNLNVSKNITVAAGSNISLEGSGGDTYMYFDTFNRWLRIYVDGVEVARFEP